MPISKVQTIDDLMGAARQRVYINRPQPSANLGKMLDDAENATKGKGMSVDERRAEMQQTAVDQLDKLYNHAKIVSGGDGPYRVKDYHFPQGKVETPGDATISKAVPEEILAAWYGKHWEEVRDRMLKAQGAPEWHGLHPHYASGNLGQTLKRPVFMLTTEDPKAISAAIIDAHAIQHGVNHQLRTRADFHPDYVQHHEFSHILFPPKGGNAPDREMMPIGKTGQANIFLPGTGAPHIDVRRMRGAAGDEGFPYAIGHIAYTSKPSELMANLAHMMRYEYGLTGKPMRTPEDRIRAVQKWIGDQPNYSKTPNAGWHKAFGPDPVLEHGPDTGKPAHGREFMRNSLRLIIPRLNKGDKKAVIDAMEGFGSTEPKTEAQYA